MVETIQRNGLWHVTLVERDLVEQSGLNQDDFKQSLGFFRYKGRTVIMSHVFNEHLVVSMDGEDDGDMKSLMAGFSKVVEYQSFCKYILMPSDGSRAPPLPTYEWDKVDPNSRYDELSSKKTTSNLVRLL